MSPTCASTRRRAPPRSPRSPARRSTSSRTPTCWSTLGRTAAVRANSASIKEERTGTLTLYPLDGSKKRGVSTCARSPGSTPCTRSAAFRPTQAGLLHILDRSGRLFEWNVDEDTATEVDAVEVGD